MGTEPQGKATQKTELGQVGRHKSFSFSQARVEGISSKFPHKNCKAQKEEIQGKIFIINERKMK